jgi:hypothetical protein
MIIMINLEIIKEIQILIKKIGVNRLAREAPRCGVAMVVRLSTTSWPWRW